MTLFNSVVDLPSRVRVTVSVGLIKVACAAHAVWESTIKLAIMPVTSPCAATSVTTVDTLVDRVCSIVTRVGRREAIADQRNGRHRKAATRMRARNLFSVNKLDTSDVVAPVMQLGTQYRTFHSPNRRTRAASESARYRNALRTG